ncbi:hypothetical protein GJ496_006569 [Pomphorhynchus laevis]|nr:hypothetical protein GJ496_006569 [Pomphorhynchus laevis]
MRSSNYENMSLVNTVRCNQEDRNINDLKKLAASLTRSIFQTCHIVVDFIGNRRSVVRVKCSEESKDSKEIFHTEQCNITSIETSIKRIKVIGLDNFKAALAIIENAGYVCTNISKYITIIDHLEIFEIEFTSGSVISPLLKRECKDIIDNELQRYGDFIYEETKPQNHINYKLE